MGQGFAYARENNGTREVVIKDWQRYCMSAFSGYLAFSGNLLKEGLSHADAVVKGTLLGKAYSIVDGVAPLPDELPVLSLQRHKLPFFTLDEGY